jgi:hypothetical protein
MEVQTYKNTADEINTLHKELNVTFESVLQKAIRIGDLLTYKKDTTWHNEWIPWIKKNLDFGEREAQRYMQIYENRTLFANTTCMSLLDIKK